MFKNYIKVFFRNLWNHIGYSACNIVGLSVGMVTCILVMLFVRYEFNWNTSNKKIDRLYRVQQKIFFNKNFDIYDQTGYVLAAELQNNIPEIEKAIVIQEIWEEYLSPSDNLSFNEKRGFYADNDIFDVFTLNFLQGNPKTALSEPFSVVLTRGLAQKYFPGQNALGKMLRASKNKLLKVTGVIEDLPFNLDCRPDYLVSNLTFKEVTGWKEYADLKFIDAGAFRTYVLLKQNTSAELVNRKIFNFIDNYIPKNFKKLYLKPLSEVHLTAVEQNDILIALYYISGIAIFILVLACINFINLSTANSNLRKKEIGIRKVTGASKFSLFKQFIGESLFNSLLAMLLAFILAEFALPFFNTIVQRPLEINYIADINLYLLVITAFIITGFLSGIFPALVLSSFQPIDIIKGNVGITKKSNNGNARSFLRKSLVTFQFSISITLIIGTFFVANQVNFMKNKNLGFQKANLLVCKVFGDFPNRSFETLRNELLRNGNILDASFSINSPFYGNWGKEINWEGANENEKMGISYNAGTYTYLETLKARLLLGRNFSNQFISDTSACIINETAQEQLGWDNPIGKKIDNNRYTIIGVVNDYHVYSVHEKIPAQYITLKNDNLQEGGIFAIRIKPGTMNQAINHVRQQFKNFFPNAIIQAAPYDKELNYGTDDVWTIVKNVFFAFSIIAVLIAANGLFGLVSFAAQRRIKEIGIRKVFGAKVSGLYLLIGKEFFYILVVSLIIAIPSGYMVSQSTPGAYKYILQFWDYFEAIMLMFITALIATVYQTTKAVYSNPVDSLKYE